MNQCTMTQTKQNQLYKWQCESHTMQTKCYSMLDASNMPSSFLMKKNLSLARGLVKMSTIWCLLSMNSMKLSPLDTWSLIK